MKRILLLSIIICLLASCSPERRLHRLITRHPQLLRTDTIRISDTTIIPEIRIDTAINHSILKDTVIITKEKLKLQLIEIKDTIYIDAYQEPDTIIITKEIPVEKIIHKEPENWIKKAWNDFKFKTASSIILLLILLGTLFKLISKRK